MKSSCEFMNVVEHAARDADDQHFQGAPRPVLHPAWHVDDYVFVQFDFLVVKTHSPLALEHVINLISALVIVQFGVGNFQMVDFRCRSVLLFQDRTDLAASLSPRWHVGEIATKKN